MPSLHESFITLHDVIVVENCETERVFEHFRFQVLKHHVGVPEFVVGGLAFLELPRRDDLPIKGHDGSEGIALGDQTQFPWGLVVVLAEGLHGFFVHGF